MTNTNKYEDILRDFDTYRFQGAKIIQHSIGAYIILECNDYLIDMQGHFRYNIFDSRCRFIASIPNNADVSVIYCDPQRLVLNYKEYAHNIDYNRFDTQYATVSGYMADDEFQSRLEALIKSNRQCKIRMYTMQPGGWGTMPQWLLSKFN